MPFTLSPNAKFTGFDDDGLIVSGGKLYTYAAGTSTLQATYADANGVSNSNPVILDSAGRATIYLGTESYKFILKDSSDVQIWSQDNISDPALTLVDGDVVGTTDTQTLTNKTLTDPTINSGTLNNVEINSPTIGNATSTSGTFTTPTIATPTFSTKVGMATRLAFGKGANVTSASTLTLGDDGNVFAITGGASIANITITNWQAGSVIILILTAGMTLQHAGGSSATAAQCLLNGGTNIVATDPTTVMLVYDGTNLQQVGLTSVNHA